MALFVCKIWYTHYTFGALNSLKLYPNEKCCSSKNYVVFIGTVSTNIGKYCILTFYCTNTIRLCYVMFLKNQIYQLIAFL